MKRSIALGLVIVALVCERESNVAADPTLRAGAAIVVLDNNDSDYKTPPFDDTALIFNSSGQLIRKVEGLNICQTVAGYRGLAAGPNGRYFLVCENVGRRLLAFSANSGEELWGLDGRYSAVTVSQSGLVYAAASSGTINGHQIHVFDEQGTLLKQANVGGIDLVVDSNHEALWAVGADIKRCNLELEPLVTIDPIGWCAVSVDLDQDGCAWVAEREHSQAKGKNRLLKISASGTMLKSIDLSWSPYCVRVNRSQGTVWVTGKEYQESLSGKLLSSVEQRTGRLTLPQGVRDSLSRGYALGWTHQYDLDGELQVEFGNGGHSIAIDPSDHSVWVAGVTKIHHYSAAGKRLLSKGDVSADQKYIIVLPKSSEK